MLRVISLILLIDGMFGSLTEEVATFNLTLYNDCALKVNKNLVTAENNHSLITVTGFENPDNATGWPYGFVRTPPALPTNVQLSMMILLLGGIDDDQQIMKITAMLHMAWTDKRIAVPIEDECRNMTSKFVIHATKNLPWYPQWLVVNGREDSVLRAESWDFSPAEVKANGDVDWYMSFEFVVDCYLQVQLFPFDVQPCSIDVGSPQYDSRVMNYITSDESITLREFDSQFSPVWKIIGVQTGVVADNYPSISFKLLLARRATFYIMALIVPTAALNAMTAALFLTTANQVEKASTSVACVVAYFFIETLVFDMSPISSDSTPILCIFFTFHCYFALAMCIIAARLIFYSEYVEEQETIDIMLENGVPLERNEENRTKEDGRRTFRSPEFYNDLCLVGYIVITLASYVAVFAYLPYKSNSIKTNLLQNYLAPSVAAE